MSNARDAIRRVVEAFERSEWSEIDVRSGNVRVHLSTSAPTSPPPATPTPIARDAAPATGRPTRDDAVAPAAASPEPSAEPSTVASAGPPPTGAHVVVSPTFGIFWRSPEPGLPPFADLGRHRRGVGDGVHRRGDEADEPRQGGRQRRGRRRVRRERRGGSERTSALRDRSVRVVDLTPATKVASGAGRQPRRDRACGSSGPAGTRASKRSWLSARPIGIRSPRSWPTTSSRSVPPSPTQSYLRVEQIVAGALLTGCDAVHPGYGFLSERAELAEACVAHGLIFVGPSADTIRRGGDKVEARRVARAAGVPTGAGSDAVSGADAALAVADGARLSDPSQGRSRGRRTGDGPRRQPGRARNDVRDRIGRGRGCVRRRAHVRGAVRRERQARRGATARRPSRRHRPPRRPGLLDAAPLPEARRGGTCHRAVRRSPPTSRRRRRRARARISTTAGPGPSSSSSISIAASSRSSRSTPEFRSSTRSPRW